MAHRRKCTSQVVPIVSVIVSLVILLLYSHTQHDMEQFKDSLYNAASNKDSLYNAAINCARHLMDANTQRTGQRATNQSATSQGANTTLKVALEDKSKKGLLHLKVPVCIRPCLSSIEYARRRLYTISIILCLD